MKKIMVMILSLMMCTALWGCGGDKEADSEPTEVYVPSEKKTEAEADTSMDIAKGSEAVDLENSEGSIRFVKAESVTDYEGDPGIRVYFEYRNLKDEENYIPTTFLVEAFQGGKECDISVTQSSSEEDSNYSRQLMTGQSYIASCVYKLYDENSPVTVKVTDITMENVLNDVWQETVVEMK